MYHRVNHKVVGPMLSQASKLLVLPALAALAIGASQPARAHVFAGASFEVSAVVVASCRVNTGEGEAFQANTVVRCNGVAPGAVGAAFASALSNPTDDEAAAAPGTRALVITY